jgi:hypothetical protein
VANIVINSSFAPLLLKMARRFKSASLRSLIVTLLGVLVRHATLIVPDTGDTQEAAEIAAEAAAAERAGNPNEGGAANAASEQGQGLVRVLLDILGDPDNVPKLRRRAMATLGETLFYITTLDENDVHAPLTAANQNNSNSNNAPPSSSPSGGGGNDHHHHQQEQQEPLRWYLPPGTVAAVARCLLEGEDEVVCHYAAKTIENVLSQAAPAHCRRFSSQEVAMRLLDLALTQKGEKKGATPKKGAGGVGADASSGGGGASGAVRSSGAADALQTTAAAALAHLLRRVLVQQQQQQQPSSNGNGNAAPLLTAPPSSSSFEGEGEAAMAQLASGGDGLQLLASGMPGAGAGAGARLVARIFERTHSTSSYLSSSAGGVDQRHGGSGGGPAVVSNAQSAWFVLAMARGVGAAASPRLQVAFLNVLNVLFWEPGDGDAERRFLLDEVNQETGGGGGASGASGAPEQLQIQTPELGAAASAAASGAPSPLRMQGPHGNGAASALASRPLRGLRQQLASNGKIINEIVRAVDRAVTVAGRAKVGRVESSRVESSRVESSRAM